ncbi:MAG: methylmalonyl-CoA mutase subunit beta [Rhodobiaceae bacterium]|nr:methylmalonyl-CoA mutase subunit beta [Rhodobiaceae bacterium]
MSDVATKLNSEFESASEQDWRRLVETALKGADFDKTLVARSSDGIPIQPLYPPAKGLGARPVSGRAGPWRVVQRVEHPDLHEASALIRADIEGGANGIELVFAASPHALGAGVTVESAADLAQVLRSVPLDRTLLRIDAGHDNRHVAALLPALAEERGIDPASFTVQFGLDPLGDLALRGRIIAPLEPLLKRVYDCAQGMKAEGFNLCSLTADGRAWSAGGASEAQELALVVASALTYLRRMEAEGMDLDEAVAHLSFTLTADANQNLTIAKFRALRVIWARVLEVLGVDAAPVHVHAETSWRMLTAHDPHVNILRGTVATFAAGIGGADSITVLPFTTAIGMPDAFARRIARNTQTVLLEESNLYKVADPAAGSGAIEALTDALAREAWEIIGRIESAGGVLAGLQAGIIQDMVAKVQAERGERLRRRKDMITGTSSFADLAEKPVHVMEAHRDDIAGSQLHLLLPEPGAGQLFSALVAAAKSGSTLTDMARARAQIKLEIDRSLSRARLSEPYEKVRGVSEAALRRTGTRPKIFIAYLGAGASRSARAGWTENLFAVAGLAAAKGPETTDSAETARAFRQAATPIACLCGSDEAYGEAAGAIAGALRDAGAAEIFMAGKPGAAREMLEAAGVGHFVYAGCDVIDALEHALLSAAADAGEETAGDAS